VETELQSDPQVSLPILRLENVSKEFQLRSRSVITRRNATLKAVDGVNLDVKSGETLGVVGESGCGKSTLARIILRLEDATSGDVYFRQQNITRLPASRLVGLRRHIQMVFQDPFASLDPRMTIGAIIAEPMVIHKGVVEKGEERESAHELLERVGLRRQYAERFPHEFSGGQRQRIGIARALASKPKLVICDEPVSALDVSVQAQILNLLKELQDDLGVTYIFIAHDLSVVRQISDRVAVMYLGKIVEIGEIEQIYRNPVHPYTQSLLAAVPANPGRQKSFQQVPKLQGEVPSPLDPPSGCHFRTRCWKASNKCAEERPVLMDRLHHGHPSACHYPESTSVDITGITPVGRQSDV